MSKQVEFSLRLGYDKARYLQRLRGKAMVKKLSGMLLFFLLILALAGCSGVETKGTDKTKAHIKIWYQRDDGKKMHVTFVKNPSQAIIVLGKGNVLHLKQAISASGARYTDGRNEFWIKGDKATLTLDGQTYQCQVIEE